MRVLFATTNGAGLGHVTRSMAIARRLPTDVTAIVFTTSQALPVVRAQGFYAEYFPSAEYADTDQRTWHRLYARRLGQLIQTYEPRVVVFDGTYPYHGLITAIERFPDLPFVWTRRPMWQPGKGQRNLHRSSYFQAILEPGEFAAAADAGMTVAHRHEVHAVGPIVLLDRDELLDRTTARKALALPDDAINVLVQLGSVNTSDISSATGMCVQRLRRHPRVRITVAESTIAGDPQLLPDGVGRVRTYPLSRYYPAFDCSLSGAGYNTYHEVIDFGLPTLFVPNRRRPLDNQPARAYHAEAMGVARAWEPPHGEKLDRALADLLDDATREKMAMRLRELAPSNGAAEAARFLMDVADAGRQP